MVEFTLSPVGHLRQMMNQEQIKQSLPAHLHQFVADQDYTTRYSEQDQATWRLVMKILKAQLEISAHPVYFEGLEQTGISLDHIPSIDEMNVCLSRLGWRAIVVDGFIPPQAFMELQSLKVLAIALDMRRDEHILYTPAPDIIHEAAGHAPIIADVEYSDYLQRFGEVGMKAIYNEYDLQLYEAVRQLSILKETATQGSDDLAQAEATLEVLLDNPGEPSELALLTRLHWWTVEYGLVGHTNDYRIYGAGLLSSILESSGCLDDDTVKKLPLTIDAIQTSYDITKPQPQLFVTKSCRHLTQILDEYAATMCYQTGGTRSLKIAAAASVVTSVELNSGLTISGKFAPPITNVIDEVIYYRTEGPTQLSLSRAQLEGHGIEHHPEGFGSPLGRICNLLKPLECATEYELQELGIRRDTPVRLDFLSGVTVSGHLVSILKDHATLLLMTLRDCTVLGPDGEILFDPNWGLFDMAIGDTIASVYAGSADPARFDVYPTASESRGAQREEAAAAHQIFHLIAEARKNKDEQVCEELAATVLAEYASNWLLQLELLDLLDQTSRQAISLRLNLQDLAEHDPELDQILTSAPFSAL